VTQFVSLDFFLMVCVLFAGLVIKPSANFLELRYIFVAGTLLGFGGEAIVELVHGGQLENRLLVPKQAPVVYRYVAACSLMFWIGYHITRWRHVPGLARIGSAPPIRAPSLRALVILAAIPIVMEVVVFGADIFLGTSDEARGAFGKALGNAGNADKPAVTYLRILGRAFAFPVAVVAGLAWKQRNRAAYWAVPSLLSLPLMAQFSRGMFLPFVAFLFGAVLLSTGRMRLNYILLAVALVVSSFVIGVAMREYARTAGLGHFADLMKEEAVEPTPVGRGFDSPLRSLVHGTSALPRTTLAFEIGPRAEGRKVVGYMLRQLPIPSFLLPASVPPTNLTDDLGLKGAARYPYPLVAEMKVFFGSLGCLLFLLLGWAIAKVDNLLNDPATLQVNPYLAAILYGLFLRFIIRSFHSGLRSSFRPIMYFGILWILWWLVRRPVRAAVRRVSPAPPVAANPRRG
jgi:hypothetical protein